MIFDFEFLLKALDPLSIRPTPNLTPPLHIYNSASRQLYTKTLDDQIQEMTETCRGIEKLWEDVSKLRREWNRHQVILHNALTPIHALPDEILASLMLQLVHTDERNKTQFTLSWVSQRMRQLILSSGQAWSRIHIAHSQLS